MNNFKEFYSPGNFMFFRIFKQSLKALLANPVRTGLTTLGIVIGIGTVVLVLSAGEGFRGYLTSQLEIFGTNTVMIETRVPPTTKARQKGGLAAQHNVQLSAVTTLKNRDLNDILRLDNVQDVYGAVIGQKIVSYRNVNKNIMIFGADPGRFRIDKGILVSGRFYTDQENIGAVQVAILGSDLAKDLFEISDPINQTIRVGDYNFLVIGVYEKRGSISGLNEDGQVFIPLITAQKKLLGIDYLLYGIAKLENQNIADGTAEDIRLILRQNHNITDPAKDDFNVTTMAQSLDTLGAILKGITFLLMAISAISLVVGGVGIMNIMYVVVTERISEIGLKKALGARNSDILGEFLIEAILITVIGGIFGIVLGASLAYLVAKIANYFNFAWKFVVPLSGIVLGLGVSGSIGLIFGVLPARAASKLDPIEALRRE